MYCFIILAADFRSIHAGAARVDFRSIYACAARGAQHNKLSSPQSPQAALVFHILFPMPEP